MRSALLLVTALLLAGCASPANGPAADDVPIDLKGKEGLLAIDLKTDKVTLLSESAKFAWMSQTGGTVVWLDETFAVLLNTTSNARAVIPVSAWLRVYDNGTGLVLGQQNATWVSLRTSEIEGRAPLPPPPAVDSRWTGASDDLKVLAAEYAASPGSASCKNDLFIRAQSNARSVGCHMRVAPDGRVGWTEGGSIRVRGLDGTVTNITGPAGGNVTNDTYVSSENGVFTADGVAHLRLTGGRQLVKTEVVGPDGAVVASVAGPTRLAIQDISADGNFLLVRASQRS